MHSEYAKLMLNEHFKNAYYIGRHLLHDQASNAPPHKFYYIGHGDAFGVAMPEKGKWGFQIWGISWVRGRSTKLDKSIAEALKGNFPKLRHNILIDKRAINGKAFVKPTWIHEAPPPATKKAKNLLPIRGQGRKRRQRVKLNNV